TDFNHAASVECPRRWRPEKNTLLSLSGTGSSILGMGSPDLQSMLIIETSQRSWLDAAAWRAFVSVCSAQQDSLSYGPDISGTCVAGDSSRSRFGPVQEC